MKNSNFSSGPQIHDPAIRKGDDGNYYLFGTHMSSAVSRDLHSFTELTREDVSPANPLFEGLLESDAFRFCTGFADGKYKAVWAPDVMYFPAMGKYLMYFCTTSSYKKSSICFASSDAITGPYQFEQVLISSGFTAETVHLTNFRGHLPDYLDETGDYDNRKWPNCIDPNLFYDREGKLWMVYGSWSGGIFLLEVDQTTGQLIHPEADPENGVDAYYGKHILGGGHRSMEGPYIIYDKVSDWYYLFVSYGWLARTGGYQIRLFRSRNATGPYADMNGNAPEPVGDHSGYGLKLIGNHDIPGIPCACMAPGHNSVLQEDDKLYLVCHQRFQCGDEHHEPRVRPMYRTADGWLTVSPYHYSGSPEALLSPALPELQGQWELLDQGTDIGASIHVTQPVSVREDGTILRWGSPDGKIIRIQDGHIEVQWEGESFHGAVIQTISELGEKTTCISAAGNNRSLWLIRKAAAISTV